MDVHTQKEFIIIEVNKKDDIESLDLSKMANLLNQLRQTPERYYDTLHIIFGGFDQNPKEIFEIKSIRNWVEKLILTFPEVLFFLEEKLHGLQNILLCLADFVSIKKMPGAVLSNPLLNTNMYVQAKIPQERAESIMIQLVLNSVMSKKPAYIKTASNRLMTFCY